MLEEKASAEKVAEAIVQKAGVAFAEKGSHGLGGNQTVANLPTTDAIAEKVMKEGARRLAHEGSEMASKAQVTRAVQERTQCCHFLASPGTFMYSRE